MPALLWEHVQHILPRLALYNITSLLLGTFALATVLNAVYNIYLHPLSRFPGPKWGIATYWWHIYVDFVERKPWATKLKELHNIYGDVVRIGPNELHFSRPSVYPEIYAQKNRWSKDTRTYRLFATRGNSNMMSILDYQSAKKRRDYTAPLFSRKNVLTLQPLVQSCIDAMCDNIDVHAAAGQPVNINDAVKCAVVDIISAVCFGRSIGAAHAPHFDVPLVHALHGTLSLIPVLVHFPWLRDISEALPRRVAAAVPQLKGLIDVTAILERQVKEIGRNPEVLTEYPHRTIFHEFMKDEATRLPDHILVDEAVAFITAGTDTTSDSLTYGLVRVLDNPAILARLRREVIDAWPRLDQAPAFETLEKLPYLTAVIKETLRMYSGIQRPLLRAVPKGGAHISGLFIPGGTAVGVNITCMHLDEEVYTDPHVFRPERWLEPDVGRLEELFVPFGRGPRTCPGINLAWQELYLMFANLIRRYDLKLHGMSSSDWKIRDCILPQYVGPDIRVLAERPRDV